MAPGSSNYFNDHFELFDNSFNPFEFGTPMNDGSCSTESALSSDNAESSLGSSSVRWPTPAEGIFTLQGCLNEDDSEVMERSPHNVGGYAYSLRTCNIFGDDPLSNFDQEPSAQLNNYTLDQLWPSSGHDDNTISGCLDKRLSYGHNITNELSTQVPWIADIPQLPLDSVSQEAIVQKQVSVPLKENQIIPRCMATQQGMATRSLSAMDGTDMSIQEDNSMYTKAMNSYIGPTMELPMDFAPYPEVPVITADLYADGISTAPSTKSTPDTSPLGATRSGIYSVLFKRRNYKTEALPILPAPAKSFPTAPQKSEGSAVQYAFGPQKPLLKRSDRRRFTDNEKERTRGVREKGSCIVCVMKNGRCDTKQICETCQKIAFAKNTKLVANHICMRGGILIFRQNIPDFYDAKSRSNMLPKSLRDPWRTIMIGDRVTISGTDSAFFPQKVALTVRVREYDTSDIDDNLVWSEGSTRSALTSYAIDPSTFPTVLQLDAWGRNLLSECSQLPGIRPYIMDKFLFAYLDAKPGLQHCHLVDLTIRLASLSTWLFEAHPVTTVGNVHNSKLQHFDISDERVEKRLSEVARSQLLLIAAEGFEATERKILFTIDSLMKSTGCDPQGALIVGLCLRRIALLYRVSLKRYRKFALDSRTNSKIEKSKAMYEALTTAYSLVYRGAKSPFSRKWRLKDHLAALGNDEYLSNLFLKVVNYERQYCEDNRDDEDDAHLKKLFLERKEGGGPRA